MLLPFIPLVQIAWAEGGMSDAERQLIVKLARSHGIVEGSAADHQLSTWLASRPDAQVFTQATRLIRAMLASPAPTGPRPPSRPPDGFNPEQTSSDSQSTG